MKIASYIVVLLVVLGAVAITATVGWRPIIGPKARALTDRKFEATPARLARGEYLVEHVSLCFGCHTTVDWKSPELKMPHGKGSGAVMVDDQGFRVVAPNLTPDPETGIGKWTDDQVARAIREGVGHDGRALFPMMPYQGFRRMSDEDLASVIVYLRSVPPVKYDPGKTSLPFPVSRLINSAPQPVEGSVPAPDTSTAVKRGEYLVTISDCRGCHTPRDKHGQALEGRELSGGNMFAESGTPVASANITPDASGISYYDENLFVQMMHSGNVKGRKLNVMMPTMMLGGMTDQDLKDIFAYLRTIKPVQHRVDNTEQATLCKIDGQMHGHGDQN